MRAISRRPQATQRRASSGSIRAAAPALSGRASPHSSTSCPSGCSRSVSEAALTVCRADTTRTPCPTISSACSAAEPCHTPSIRVAFPLTAAASGTVASISSWPGDSASLRLASVSEWLRKGTLRMTVSASRTACALSWAEKSPVPAVALARSAASSARTGSRDPIAPGTPARPKRTAKPKPRAPEAPMIATLSAGAAGTAAEYRVQAVSVQCSAFEPGLPRALSVREVGPRDGFQNEPETIPTDRKVELIDALARTGLRRLEVTSFVRPDVISQLADAGEVLARIDVPAEVGVSVSIPNERGLDRALKLRAGATQRARPLFDEINVFMSASETHNRKNVNRSIAEWLS